MMLHSTVLPCSGARSACRLCVPRSPRLRANSTSVARGACRNSSGDDSGHGSGGGAPTAQAAQQLSAACQEPSSGGGASPPVPVQQTRSSVAPTPSSGTVLAAAALLACVAAAAHPEAAAAAAAAAQHSPPVSLYDVAEGEEFWGNVAKYGRYFVTVMLGTGYVMVQPVMAAFKRPATAAAALVAIVGGGVLLKLTLDAMLGIQEPFAYEPGSVVPYL